MEIRVGQVGFLSDSFPSLCISFSQKISHLPVAYLNTIFFTSFPFLVDSNLLSCLPCSWPEFCHSVIADGDLPNIEHAPSAIIETYR